MKTISSSEFQDIRKWFYRNARDYELAQFKYHFEDGAKNAILDAVVPYQNPDGGVGHAVEPDIWNPDSSPGACDFVARNIMSLDFDDTAHPVISGILRYLDSGEHFVNNRWLFGIPSNDDHPHAPWWSHSPDASQYNPAAALTGFILQYAPPGSPLFAKGCSLAFSIVNAATADNDIEMHSLECLNTLVNAMKHRKLFALFDINQLEKHIHKRVNELIRSGYGSWDNYGFRPSDYIKSPKCPIYGENRKYVDEELDYLTSSRTPGGVWEINWNWSGYEREFAISGNWWRAALGLNNLRFLRAFGRLEGRQ